MIDAGNFSLAARLRGVHATRSGVLETNRFRHRRDSLIGMKCGSRVSGAASDNSKGDPQ
ncbi:protein of unknown function [Nitrospira defluvii]|uniref:Uncharacterized protein n=1 Tax=Nitrospira defluvii TaxID=330214 RepID=D8PHT9_9BACT|nr:protein of unknown function [Nitrospira defluvii]